MLAVHVAGYLDAVFLVLSPVQGRACSSSCSRALFGLYLGCSFAPNHKGMPILDDERQLDFLRRQVLTSRNVRGGWLIDFALGGLNYQIEHHLFPSMPVRNLRRSRPLVRRFCAARDVVLQRDEPRGVLRPGPALPAQPAPRLTGRPMDRQGTWADSAGIP